MSLSTLHLGPVCTDFSMMGSRKKEESPGFRTHQAYYKEVAPSNDIVVIENVVEYPESIVKRELGPAWEVRSWRIDPRIFGLGTARARVYMIAIRINKLAWIGGFNVQDFFEAISAQVALSASDYFWMDLPPSQLSPSEEPCCENIS